MAEKAVDEVVASGGITLSPVARVIRTVMQVVLAFAAVQPALIAGLGLSGSRASEISGIVAGVVLVVSTAQNLLEHFGVLPVVAGKAVKAA